VDCEGNAHNVEAIFAPTRVTPLLPPEGLARLPPLVYLSGSDIAT